MQQTYYWDIANATGMGRYLTRTEGKFIAGCLEQHPAVRTILDVGGGSGRFAIPLTTRGYHVLVTEASRVPLDSLKPRAPHVPCLLTSEQTGRLPVADSSVDCVLCIEVPYLVEDTTWFFEECYRVLREQGILIVTAHNMLSYKGLGKHFVLGQKQFYNYSLRNLHARARKAGFAILHEHGFNWLPATRASNSALIPMAAYMEKQLQTLFRWSVHFSPWVLILAQKRDTEVNYKEAYNGNCSAHAQRLG
jgi:2-polyprenyl-3-methyl-5-hydroxy-6-metoxy-1,4-benzoquinol methylase